MIDLVLNRIDGKPISRVYNMDCMEGMKEIPDKFFELSICDPPYGIGANNMTLGNGKKHIYRGDDDWDRQAPPAEYFTELRRVSRHQIIWGANHFISRLPLDSSCWIFWDKGTGENDFADGELAWTSFTTTVRKFVKSWVGANAKEKSDVYGRIHPTQKPIALYKWLLTHYAQPGNKILDTHMGSQSSRIAAYQMGFDFWGWEIDKEYFEAGNKRFKEQTAQLKLL